MVPPSEQINKSKTFIDPDLFGLYELLELLIPAGCDPNKIGMNGETILNKMMKSGFRCRTSLKVLH